MAVGPRPDQVQAYDGSTLAMPPSPISSGLKVSTMNAISVGSVCPGEDR